jgi:hypothetical protein
MTLTFPFELHLTVSPLSTENLSIFCECCQSLGAKPLLIELAKGIHQEQPMLSKVVQTNSLDNALLMAKDLTKDLGKYDFTVKRVKIEIPISAKPYLSMVSTPQFSPYFEWHGKITINRLHLLLQICQQYSTHLSKNALKEETHSRFITLREFGEEATFRQRTNEFMAVLSQNEFTLLKTQYEYCIYDTNVMLDKGWLYD